MTPDFQGGIMARSKLNIDSETVAKAEEELKKDKGQQIINIA